MIAEPFDAMGCLLALLLPWALGIALVRWLLLDSAPRNLPLLLGHGFFVGLFAVTLLLRLWDAAGLRLDFVPLAATVAAGALLLALAQWFRRGLAAAPTAGAAAGRASGWQLVLVLVLLGLMSWRYATLLQELLLRPLYAWDAWMNWAPKAVVWFHHGALVEFVDPDQWAERADPGLYTLGNKQAWDYPVTVPLIQLWFMLAMGTADHSAIYLPWLLVPLCLASALWGHLRASGVSVAIAVTCCYLLLNMPYVNVHSVLAGYADIWQAAAFTLGVCALYEWRLRRQRGYLLLWLAMAVLCTQLKMPGIVLGLILLAGGLREWLNLGWRRELGLALSALGALAVVALIGVSFEVPHLGRFALDMDGLRLGALGGSRLAIHPVGGAFLESFGTMINWNLLGYLLPPFLLYCLYYHRGAVQGLATEVLVVLVGCAFVSLVFVLTNYATQALNFVALNRALLYPLPALLFVCALYFPVPRERPADLFRAG